MATSEMEWRILFLELVQNAAKEELKRIHDLSYIDNDISLDRRLQRQGFYWSDMAKDATNVQRNCSRYQESVDINQCLFIKEAGYCWQPYLDFLQDRLLRPN